MDTKDLEKFDPTVQQLKELVSQTQAITATDLTDSKQLEVVKRNRIALKTARVKIENTGKELRADAIKFQKAVIAKENELVAIIAPEEERLKSIEAEAEALAIKAKRLEVLPVRKERLAAIGVTHQDDFLLDLEDNQFESLFNQEVAKKNERDRLAAEEKARQDKAEADRIQAEKDAEARAKIEAEERRQADEREKIEAQKRANDAEALRLKTEAETREREEKARQEERERLAREEADRKAAEEKAEADRKEKERLAQLEAEEKVRKDKEVLEKQEAYKKFKIDCGMTADNIGDFKEVNTGTELILYKKVGVFKL